MKTLVSLVNFVGNLISQRNLIHRERGEANSSGKSVPQGGGICLPSCLAWLLGGLKTNFLKDSIAESVYVRVWTARGLRTGDLVAEDIVNCFLMPWDASSESLSTVTK